MKGGARAGGLRALVACGAGRGYLTETGGAHRSGYCGRLLDGSQVSAPSFLGGGHSPARQLGGAHRRGFCGRLLDGSRVSAPSFRGGGRSPSEKPQDPPPPALHQPKPAAVPASGLAVASHGRPLPRHRPVTRWNVRLERGPGPAGGSGTMSLEGGSQENLGRRHGRYRPGICCSALIRRKGNRARLDSNTRPTWATWTCEGGWSPPRGRPAPLPKAQRSVTACAASPPP